MATRTGARGSGRGTKTNGDPDRRGSTADRRVRRLWLVHTYGDGVKVPCVHCKRTLQIQDPTADDYLQVDRIVPGGSYRRSNIQPSCGSCNNERGDNVTWTFGS